MGITILVSIIFAAGLLGGIANYYMEQANGAGLRKSLLMGLTAAATVPLFLKTVSSNLMGDCLKGEDLSLYLVFFGFCTVAALFSSKFLQSLADKLLKEVQEVKQKQEELSDTTDVLVAQNSDPSEVAAPIALPPAGSDGNEFESFKPGDSAKSPSVVAWSEEQRVLAILQSSKFAFRTVEGIAKDAGLDMAVVQSKLLEMEIQGKVKKTRRTRDGVMLWSLG